MIIYKINIVFRLKNDNCNLLKYINNIYQIFFISEMVRRTYDDAFYKATSTARLSLAAIDMRYANKLHTLYDYVKYMEKRVEIARRYLARLKRIAKREDLEDWQQQDIKRYIQIVSTASVNPRRRLTAARKQLRHETRNRFMAEFRRIPKEQWQAILQRADNQKVDGNANFH